MLINEEMFYYNFVWADHLQDGLEYFQLGLVFANVSCFVLKFEMNCKMYYCRLITTHDKYYWIV